LLPKEDQAPIDKSKKDDEDYNDEESDEDVNLSLPHGNGN